MEQQLTDDARDKVDAAITAGDLVRAIALYRNATGLGLARAKSDVEAMAARRPARPAEGRPDALPEGVRDALFAGRKIQAIKLYRQAYHVDLRTAKEAVEAAEATLRLSEGNRFAYPAAAPGGGSARALLILLVIAVVIVAALYVLRHR